VAARRGAAFPDVLWLILVPLAVHFPHWSGWLSENPAYLVAQLATQGTGHGPLAGYPGFIDGNSGVTVQALGGAAARDWLRGTVPWWNPWSGQGLPLAAELQNGAFFLPFVLLLRLFDGVVWLKMVLQVVAGLSCRGLLRGLGVPRVPSLACALCFGLNGTFAWFGHGPILPIAFLPLLLLGVETAIRAPALGALLIGAAIGWSLLAGFPEVAYFDGLLAFGWAMVRLCRARPRGRYFGALAMGLAAGVLVAAPPLWAFVQALPDSWIGFHADFRAAFLPAGGRASLLFPYLYGPPMAGGLSLTGAGSEAWFLRWYHVTGYLDLPVLMLAVMAVRAGARDAALRWYLAAFLVVALGRVCGVPVLAGLANAVPLVRYAAAHLYLIPACQMAATVLAALALRDWAAGELPVLSIALGLGSVCLSLLVLPGAGDWLRALAGVPWHGVYTVAAVGAALGGAFLVAWLGSTGRVRAAAVILAVHAGGLFFVTLLAGTPAPRGLDRRLIGALHGLGPLALVESDGVLAPNYGALFGIGQIDSNYLPSPKAWEALVGARLDPGWDGVNYFPDPSTLPARLPALRASGVGFVLVPAGVDPFVPAIGVARAGTPDAVPLTVPFHGVFPGSWVHSGTVRDVSVVLGTYGGRAAGTLLVRVCQGARCADGAREFDGAADNRALLVPLAGGLRVDAGMPVDYVLSDETAVPGRSFPPALWRDGMVPAVRLLMPRPADAPRAIYADTVATLYALGGAEQYYRAPGCTVLSADLLRVRLRCAAPSRLTRRVLDFPGWRVTVTPGAGTVPAGGAVALPAGTVSVAFRYAPPWAWVGWLGCGAGAGLLGVLGASAGRKLGRRRMIGRSMARRSTTAIARVRTRLSRAD
jgi:hypothetical protein